MVKQDYRRKIAKKKEIDFDLSGSFRCESCFNDLTGKPKIIIDDGIFCFTCSLTELLIITESRKKYERVAYEFRKNKFDKLKAIHDKEFNQWVTKRNKYLSSYKIHAYWLLLIIPFGYFFQIFGVAAIFGLWFFLKIKVETIYGKKFDIINPRPNLAEEEPKAPGEPTIEHYLQDNIPGKILQIYRKSILKRDEYTCQVCGYIYQSWSLEVHHIIPRSEGGLDYAENLITLCKFCHEREYWFNHKYKSPKTSGYTFRKWVTERSRGFNRKIFKLENN